jgi:deazaflavin-dependent oxidoreductase (nitroreductase family)
MIDSIMENEALTRRFFKALNRFMLLMWRLGMGPMLQNPYVGYIMVLNTTGHRSGLLRRAPVNYVREGDTVYCLPGFGKRTHWYRNLMADPFCQLWLPDGQWAGKAEAVTDEAEKIVYLRRVLVNAGFATWLVEGINPAEMSDDDIRALIADRYPDVMRIQLSNRVSTPNGPGDLAWVWPVLLAFGVAYVVWRSVQKRKA